MFVGLKQKNIMKPIDFEERNVIYAKDQPQYMSLPAYKNETKEGEVVSCWNLSFWERLRVLISGKIWLSLMSFNNPLTPSYLTTDKSEVIPTNHEKSS